MPDLELIDPVRRSMPTLLWSRYWFHQDHARRQFRTMAFSAFMIFAFSYNAFSAWNDAQILRRVIGVALGGFLVAWYAVDGYRSVAYLLRSRRLRAIADGSRPFKVRDGQDVRLVEDSRLVMGFRLDREVEAYNRCLERYRNLCHAGETVSAEEISAIGTQLALARAELMRKYNDAWLHIWSYDLTTSAPPGTRLPRAPDEVPSIVSGIDAEPEPTVSLSEPHLKEAVTRMERVLVLHADRASASS